MFQGFPIETVEYLRDLRANNTKEWFDDNRARYDEFYIGVAREFVEAAGEALSELVPDIVAQPKVNGSIFKINRDVRFSKDKTPYKDHLDFRFWQGDRKTAPSALMFRITVDDYGVVTGAPGFAKEHLAKFRDGVVADWSNLGPIIGAAEAAGYHLDGEALKKVPPGYEATTDEQARLLRHKGLMVGSGNQPLGPEVHTAGFMDVLMGHWERLLPTHRWLTEHLG